MSTVLTQSSVLEAPISKVWPVVRRLDFVWNPAVLVARLDGKDNTPSTVGGDRWVVYADKTVQKIRISELSDAHYSIGWDVVESQPAVTYSGVSHLVQLRRITDTERTLVEWTTTFSKDIDNNVIADQRIKQVENFNGLQKFVTSKYNFHTTGEDVVRGYEAKGKTFLITGVNSGLGFETARCLAKAHAHVVGTVRDEKKGKEFVEQLKKEVSDANVEFMICDLNNLKSVQNFANAYIAKKYPLHVLILNAGIMGVPFGKTDDGFESHFGVNHVAHHYLTTLLLPVLKASAPSRIVSVSALAHVWAPINWDFIQNPSDKDYKKMIAYAYSKTANILFTKHLNALLQKEGAKVTVNTLHPGVFPTNLLRSVPADELKELFKHPIQTKTVREGATSSLVAAIDPAYAEKGGFYLDNGNPVPVAKWAENMEDAARLWDVTEKLIASAPTLKK
jgi:NAD(P)-dependent dehydrogenase (short-subunit alcohol dehydrogenase family)